MTALIVALYRIQYTNFQVSMFTPGPQLTDFPPHQAEAILELSQRRAYITPANNYQGEMRGQYYIGNPESNPGVTTQWYSYSDQEGKQWLHPPGDYTGRKDSYLYALRADADYAGYLERVRHDSNSNQLD